MFEMNAVASAKPSANPLPLHAPPRALPKLQPLTALAAVPSLAANHDSIAADADSSPIPAPAVGQCMRWLAAMLDEIDYGMVLLDDGHQVLHVNQAADTELEDDHPLQLAGRRLRTRRPDDEELLQDALTAAGRGLRRLLTLGERGQSVSVAVVPLGTAGRASQVKLVMLGKRSVCENLSMLCFARHHSLTPTETRVLEALCQGLAPREVADRYGVCLATVRTQIGSIRTKTGADSIRDLVCRVAMLPPMVSSLREHLEVVSRF
jgi:DNA-binding CsgD family transcriptional regulator